MCLVFTTFNMDPNIYWAQQWYGEIGVTTSIDHTFKVSHHLQTTHTCTDTCTYTCVYIHIYLCLYIQLFRDDTPHARACLCDNHWGRTAATSRDNGTGWPICPTWLHWGIHGITLVCVGIHIWLQGYTFFIMYIYTHIQVCTYSPTHVPHCVWRVCDYVHDVCRVYISVRIISLCVSSSLCTLSVFHPFLVSLFTHVYVCSCTLSFLHICCVNIHTHTYTYVYIRVYRCIRTPILYSYFQMYVYEHMYTYMYVRVARRRRYIFVSTHRQICMCAHTLTLCFIHVYTLYENVNMFWVVQCWW